MRALVLAMLVGCGGGYEEVREQVSDGGTYVVYYTPVPDPIPFNETFALVMMAHDAADTSVMFEDVGLALDVTMPDHGHGMNTEPEVTVDEYGVIDVTGMLFHMEGWWQMDATVTRGGASETATFYVECCG